MAEYQIYTKIYTQYRYLHLKYVKTRIIVIYVKLTNLTYTIQNIHEQK